ncbi:hypothetical protein ABTM49_20715, partial [Acinetobacter baumannii]
KWDQNPSTTDWATISKNGDSIGRTDGSVIFYQLKNSYDAETGKIGPKQTITPLAPPTPLDPYQFLDRSEPDAVSRSPDLSGG